MVYWARNCGSEDLLTKGVDYLLKNCKLCSIYFENTVFSNNQKNRLCVTAVPIMIVAPFEKIDLPEMPSTLQFCTKFVNFVKFQASTYSNKCRSILPQQLWR